MGRQHISDYWWFEEKYEYKNFLEEPKPKVIEFFHSGKLRYQSIDTIHSEADPWALIDFITPYVEQNWYMTVYQEENIWVVRIEADNTDEIFKELITAMQENSIFWEKHWVFSNRYGIHEFHLGPRNE